MRFITYFHAYIHLRFKHNVLGTHYSCLGCELVDFVSLLVVSEEEEGVVALHLPIRPLKPHSGLAISRSIHCSTTGVTKAMVCVILSVG